MLELIFALLLPALALASLQFIGNVVELGRRRFEVPGGFVGTSLGVECLLARQMCGYLRPGCSGLGLSGGGLRLFRALFGRRSASKDRRRKYQDRQG